MMKYVCFANRETFIKEKLSDFRVRAYYSYSIKGHDCLISVSVVLQLTGV